MLPTWVPYHAPYSGAKLGIVGMMLNLITEAAENNVGVTVMCPGGVQSGMKDNNARYRPARFGGPQTGPLHIHTASFQRNTIEMYAPEAIAPMVLRAVRHNRPFVFDHPEQRQLLRSALVQAEMDAVRVNQNVLLLKEVANLDRRDTVVRLEHRDVRFDSCQRDLVVRLIPELREDCALCPEKHRKPLWCAERSRALDFHAIAWEPRSHGLQVIQRRRLRIRATQGHMNWRQHFASERVPQLPQETEYLFVTELSEHEVGHDVRSVQTERTVDPAQATRRQCARTSRNAAPSG